MQQLTIYDVIPQVKKYRPGDVVKVVKVTDDMDAETSYYLSLFQGKKGVVVKVNRHKVLSYTVDFNGSIAVLRYEDLDIWRE